MKTAIGNWPSTLRTLKSRLSAQWHHSQLPAFFQWWRQQLIACLPMRWKEVLESSNTEQLYFWQTDTLPDALPAQEPQRRQILILSRDHILLIPVQLPAAAAADADSALAFEMDKYTPFKASEVYFDKVRVQTTSHNSSHLYFDLAVTLRERLDALLDGLTLQGHRVDVIDALDDQGKRLNLNLLPAHRRTSHANPKRRLQQVLTGVSLVMLIAVMLLWVHNRQSALNDMASQVKTLRNDTQQIQALQQQLNGLLGAGRFIQDQKSQASSKTALLRELTTCIPSNTWLEQLEINQQGAVSLSGQSSQASELIDKMKACTSLESLQFQGIIQPDSSTGMDRFSLTAHLRIKDDSHASAPDSP
ncbi:PilN domain-containing protein [Pseudomonas gingeri]